MAHHDVYSDDKNLFDLEADRQYLAELEGSRLLGEVAEPEMELDDLTTTLEDEGIDVTPDGEMPSQRQRRLRQLDDPEEVDLTPSADLPDKTSDPVRLYLREMGTVPLLTREGEIEIAKRFERGHFRVIKAISRSPLAIREVIALGSDLQRGVRSIKAVVVFDEEDVTDEIVAQRLRATLGDSWQSTTRKPARPKRRSKESAGRGTLTCTGAAVGKLRAIALRSPGLCARSGTHRQNASA